MPIYSAPGYVACTPFLDTSVKSTVRRGVDTIDQQTKLTRLYVVHDALIPLAGNEFLFLCRGDAVFVPGSLAKSDNLAQVFEGEDDEAVFQYVLIQTAHIRLYDIADESEVPREIPAAAWPSRKVKTLSAPVPADETILS